MKIEIIGDDLSGYAFKILNKNGELIMRSTNRFYTKRDAFLEAKEEKKDFKDFKNTVWNGVLIN